MARSTAPPSRELATWSLITTAVRAARRLGEDRQRIVRVVQDVAEGHDVDAVVGTVEVLAVEERDRDVGLPPRVHVDAGEGELRSELGDLPRQQPVARADVEHRARLA